jgi:thiol-disulfide isomerase/thioredoxin
MAILTGVSRYNFFRIRIITNSIWFLLLCLSFHSRAQKLSAKNDETNSGRTILTVFFEDTVKYKDPKLFILDYSTLTDTKNMPSLTTNLQGHRCKFELKIVHPLFVQLSGVLLNVIAYNMFSKFFFTDGVFLEPGDSVSVQVNNADQSTGFIFPRIHYSGRGAQKMTCQQEIFQNTNTFHSAVAPENWQRFGLADSVTDMITNTINKYQLTSAAKSILRATLISMLTPDISEVLSGTDEVPGMNFQSEATKELYWNRIKKSLKLINPSDKNLLYSRIDFFDCDILKRRALLEFAMEEGLNYPKAFSLASFNALVKYVQAGPLKERVLAHYVSRGMDEVIGKSNPLDSTELRSVTRFFLEGTDKKTVYYNYIKDKGENLEKGLVKGAPAFPFALPDISGNTVKLEDLKGKVVLMDFMFNNCLPCRQMIPYLKNIAKNYGDEDFVILTVCADKDREQWRQAIVHAEGLPAIYCYTEGKGFDHPLIRHYAIHAYPTLVLLDRRGQLVNPRAPDPREDQGRALNNLIKATLSSE